MWNYLLKRFVCHNTQISKLRSGMYIFLIYSLTSAQWLKITELGYICATTVSFKVVDLGYPKIFPSFNFF